MIHRIFILLTSVLLLSFHHASVSDVELKEMKGDHFIVYYQSSDSAARTVLRSAEKYYDQIAKNLGYTRYDDIWTWDNRCEIYLYASQAAYLNETGAESWAGGHASLRDRTIYSFEGQKNFLEQTLPHELSHLIFSDFVGMQSSIALWLHEGIAISQEKSQQKDIFLRIASNAFSSGSFIPLEELTTIEDLTRLETNTVTLFYAQSAAVVTFLLDRYHSKPFTGLCRDLRDGFTLQKALERNYKKYRLKSLSDLETALINHYSSS